MRSATGYSMTERKKDLLALATLLGILIVFFAKILFTHKIIRAPDIVNEYYWSVMRLSAQHFLDIFRLKLTATWDIYNNSGNTLEGGGQGGQFLFWQGLLYYFLSPPSSVAWHIVLHLFLGACGTFFYCRAIGASRTASLLGGLVFALAPENASLINAGHVLKIATIAVAPWAFYLFERGFQSRRLIFFLGTGLVLALQFFYTHWQIAYYTCLGIGLYGIFRTAGVLIAERRGGEKASLKLVALNLIMLVFFLTTVAIDLMPLASWSTETNRGAQSGANQGKGGLEREEAMLWSMPPEELSTFIIPGLFGFSRQEAGENPSNIGAFYWGRMSFTQTTSYLGLLPWLLLPLPLVYRRDRYTWIALFAVAAGLIFSMGKYTFIYQFLFDHFPGINRFRVPKMIMFLPVLAMGVLAARGLDILRDEETRKTRSFRYFSFGLLALPLLLLGVLGIEQLGKNAWITGYYEMFAQPTRYEQGPQLVAQRWHNLVVETGIAAVFAACYAGAVVVGFRQKMPTKGVLLVLLALYLADVGRVDAKFMYLADPPKESGNYTTPVIEFLAKQSKEFRVLPLNGGPGPYSSKNIPVMFIPMPVQQKRWQDLLDTFNFAAAAPDVLNVKYLIVGAEQYQQEKAQYGTKFVPAFTSPDNREVVLENRNVLPKAWLVPSVVQVREPRQALAALQDPSFDPRNLAAVEAPPPISMPGSDGYLAVSAGVVKVTRYEGEHITVATQVARNALLVLGEKYYKGWKATIDGAPTEIYPVDYILRGIYLTPGNHTVEFVFDPLPFKIGKYLTLTSFAFFALMLGREVYMKRRMKGEL